MRTDARILRRTVWLLVVAVLGARPVRAYQGFGAATRGGDNSPTVEVTSLADSGPGTLRAALEGGDRRIVFGVGGTIRLKKMLTLNKPNVTIDGRGAPAPGITIEKKPLVIRDTHDVIVRDIRIRDSDDDNFRIYGKCRNIVIDHCSSTRARDGAIDITRGARDVTVSWCLIGGTEKAMLVDAVSNLSIHHNLFTNNGHRHPQLHNVTGFDVRNNVIRNWRVYGIRVRAGSTGNIVSNVFGPSSNPRKRPTAALIVLRRTARQADAAGKVYVTDNVGPGKTNVNELGTADQPRPAPSMRTLRASEVEAAVLRDVGARPADLTDQIYLRGPRDLQPRSLRMR